MPAIVMLTPEEKVRIRHHMGSYQVQQASTIILGVPASVDVINVLESAMDRLIPEALTHVRNIIAVLDKIEAQKIEDLDLLAVEQVDEIKINVREQLLLDVQYKYWRGALSNAFGVDPNVFDNRGGPPINVPVIHG